MSWLGRTGSAILIAACVVLTPFAAAPAAAVEPLPPPVEPLPVQPSQAVKAWHSSAGQMGDRAFELLRALANGVKPESLGGQGKPPASVPKPITAPKPLNNTLGALSMVTFGWAIAANGTIAIQAVASGQEFDTVYCSQPDWYQGVTTFVSLGMGPGCTSAVSIPNADFLPGLAPLQYGTFNVVYEGVAGAYYCYTFSGQLEPGFAWGWISTEGRVTYPGLGTSPCPSPQRSLWGFPGMWANPPQLVVENMSTGATVAEMSPKPSNPNRTPRCRITWEDGSVTTGVGSTYTELDGIPVSAAGLGCEEAFVSQPGRGPGLMPERIEVESEQEGGAITTIADDTVPDFTESERQGLWTTSTGGLTLMKVVNGVELSCMTWEANCVGWWPDTADGTNPTTTTGTYRCLFAGQLVDLAECGPYRHTFDTQTGTPTVTDPFTGTQQPWGNATPQSQQQGMNTINPSTGPGTSPGDTCMSEWSAAANPIEWVLHPVKCALVWAFVPRTPVVEAGIASIGTAAGNVTLVAPLLELVDELPSQSGCDGLPLSLTFFGQSWEGRLLEACEGEAAAAAMVVNGLMTLALVTASVLALARYAAAVFGFVGPGGSFEQAERATGRVIEVQQRSAGRGGS